MYTNYTPGDWVSEYCGKNRIAVFKVSDKRRIATVAVRTPMMDEANARLISAAPDLLEACKNAEADLWGLVSDYLDLDPETANHPAARTIRELKHAIAKAEGGE